MASASYQTAKKLADTGEHMLRQAREMFARSKDETLPAEERQRLRSDADKLLDRIFEIGEISKGLRK